MTPPSDPSPTKAVRPALAAEVRAGIFHFTVFLTMAVTTVYFGIWLSEQGITPDQIGLINAVPVLVLMGVNLFIGRIADRASDWRVVILILALLAGAVPIGLFFVNEFWGILLVWTLCATTSHAIAPLTDAATVRLTNRNGSDFGTIRAWGTVGYTVTGVVTGWLIMTFGSSAFVPIFLAASLIRAAAALQLPNFRAPRGTVQTVAAPGARTLREVMKPWFILTLLAGALIQGTHSILGVFTALVWHDQGIPDSTIGLLVATAAGAEAIMMFVWRKFGRRVSARQMLMAAAIAVIVRWTIMALDPPVAVLFFTQSLHAITYALGYFGIVHFIANWTSEDIAAEAQGFAFVVQQGVAVIAMLGFGFVFASLGIQAFFAMAGFGALALVCIAVSLKMQPAK